MTASLYLYGDLYDRYAHVRAAKRAARRSATQQDGDWTGWEIRTESGIHLFGTLHQMNGWQRMTWAAAPAETAAADA